MYAVHDDVVDTVIGPPDYIEQVVNERRHKHARCVAPAAGIEAERAQLACTGLRADRAAGGMATIAPV
jgi:hypothetical protein